MVMAVLESEHKIMRPS